MSFRKGASEFSDPVSRRHFVKIMSASFALAGLGLMASGCRRPEEELVPFSKAPEDGYNYGTPEYFATAMPTRTGAVPLVVKSYDGRPIKIEGNALYPDGNGGTDRYVQASILDLYDPDRAQRFAKDGKTVSRDEALKALDDLSKKFSANGGEGLAFLAESSTSPSRARLQKIIAQKFPKARWFAYDSIDSDIYLFAATQAFVQTGEPLRAIFNFNKAKVILSLDCDFLGGEDDAHNHIRKFATGRKAGEGMNRLYAVESLFTLTGLNADHRLRVAASLVYKIAAAILAEVTGTTSTIPAGIDAKWVSECAKDLIKNGKNSLVVAGQRQPIEVHLLSYAINAALSNFGNTIEFYQAPDLAPRFEALITGELEYDLHEGKVETLVILGGNPVYNKYLEDVRSQDWAQLLRKAKTVLRLGYYEDETAERSNWHFPAAHYLESWGDAVTSDGTLVPIQPLIQPLFGGLTELEFLARLAGETQTNPYDIVRTTFGSSEEAWKKFLFNGFKVGPASSLPNRRPSSPLPTVAPPAGRQDARPTSTNLEVIFFRDAKMDDGRYANNGWMQELPDPITKMVWDNAVLISRKTAANWACKTATWWKSR